MNSLSVIPLINAYRHLINRESPLLLIENNFSHEKVTIAPIKKLPLAQLFLAASRSLHLVCVINK